MTAFADQIGLDSILPEHHGHRIVDVRRRDIAIHIDLFQRLDQLGLGCLCHGAYVPQMMSSERLSKCRRRLPKAERDAGKRSDGPTGAEPEELTRRRRR